MRRHIGTMLRLMLAAAGLAYIVWSVTWTDQLVLPAGFELADGQRVDRQITAPLLEGDPTERGDTLVVRVARAADRGATATLSSDQVGHGDDDVRYQPGVGTTLAGAYWPWLAVGLLLMGALPPVQAVRWLILLRSQRLHPGWGKSMRLTMVGLFFNFCMPGMTGGDVAKAYYAAVGSGNRAAAVMSVVFDRIAGLISIVLLAGLVGLFMLYEPAVRELTAAIWAGLGVMTLLTLAYFSQRVRRRLGVTWLQKKLGPDNLLTRIDAAAFAYRGHPGAVAAAVLVSMPAHLAQMIAAALAGWALGIDLSLGVLLTVLPIVFFLGAMPITYQGLGVMEAVAFALLLDPAAATANQIVGMLLLARLYLLIYAAGGALVLLRGDMHMFPQVDAQMPVPTEHAPAAQSSGTLST